MAGFSLGPISEGEVCPTENYVHHTEYCHGGHVLDIDVCIHGSYCHVFMCVNTCSAVNCERRKLELPQLTYRLTS